MRSYGARCSTAFESWPSKGAQLQTCVIIVAPYWWAGSASGLLARERVDRHVRPGEARVKAMVLASGTTSSSLWFPPPVPPRQALQHSQGRVVEPGVRDVEEQCSVPRDSGRASTGQESPWSLRGRVARRPAWRSR